jgi:sugar lactone lactonase YvrE
LGNTVRALQASGPFPSSAPVFSGNGIPATTDGAAPSYNRPQGIAPWPLPSFADGIALVVDSGSALRGVRANGFATTLLSGLPAPYNPDTLQNPSAAVQDGSSGTIYVSNQAAHTIVALPAGGKPVFIIAGASPSAQGFVDGPGYAARFRFPQGVALRPAAPPFIPLVIYVADAGNHAVRAVSGNGVVSTLAGSTAGATGAANGVGTAALFSGPLALALDATGASLYVSEGGNHALRAVNLATAAVSTLAGLGVPAFADGPAPFAAFNYPNGLAVANATVFFVGDQKNFRVRMLTCNALPAQPLGYYYSAVAGGSAPCPPGTFGATRNLTTAACSGLCSSPPGWGCGLASASASGSLCPAGYACVGGAAPPSPCACPDACPAGTASAAPAGAAAWAVSTLATLPLATANYPPRALALGAVGSGAAYVADDGGARIWQVTLASGAVAALSGSGVAGYADGAAALAQYNRPLSLAFCAPASLFIADFDNNRLRLVALPAGTASTAAGSGAAGSADAIGTAASFNGPVALAVNPSAAFLFVAEYYGCVVRRVAVAGYAVVTLAGAPAVGAYADGAGAVARFYWMASIAVLGDGTLAVADRGNRRVRLLFNATSAAAASNVTVLTLVGWGGNRTGAVWADGPTAPAPFAALGFPEGLVGADGGGTLFFTERASLAPSNSAGRVRRVALAGPLAAAPAVSTVVGPLTSAPLPGGDFDAPGGAAAYLGGPTALINAGNGTLFTLTGAGALKALRCGVCPQGSWCANGAPRPCPAGSYGAAGGLGIASDCLPCAAVPGWACAPGGTSPGGMPCPAGAFCPGSAAPAQPCACAAACAAGGLASDPLAGGPPPAWLFTIVSGSGAAAGADGPSATVASHGAPAGLALSARTGTLYVADFTRHAIRTVGGGVTATLAGTGAPGAANGIGSSASFFNPVGLALAEASGTLFVGDFTNNLIRAVSLATAAVTTLAGNGSATSLDGVGIAASFNGPSGLALDAASGVLYVAEQSACAVRAIALASGAVTRLAGWGGTCAGAPASGAPLWATNFSRPTGLAFNPAQKVLYVTDFLSSRVVALDVAGGGSAVAAGGGAAGGADGAGTAAGFGSPLGVALDATGTLLFVADYGVNRVRRIALGTAGAPSNVSTVGGLACPSCPSAWNPYHVAAAGNGTLFFTDFTHNRVLSAKCGTPCFPGYYCLDGAPPVPCPPGTYGTSAVLTAASACTPCTAAPGWGCGAGSTTAAGAPCPSGYRCTGGAAPPALCPCPGACTTTIAASPVLLADARGDYRVTNIGLTSASFNGGAGISDAEGTGRWNYFNGVGSNLLVFGGAGNAGKTMYGATGQVNNLPAIGTAQIFSNVPAPPPGKLTLHVGDTNAKAAVLRWTAGTTISNLTVLGSFQKTIFVVPGAKFDIFVNGSNRFTVGTAALDALAPQHFRISGVGIVAGQSVEFVFSTTSGSTGMIGNLQATIWGAGYFFYSPPGGAAPPAMGALWAATTLLGGGSASNLDGLGSTAALEGPSSVTLGPDGALYVPEYAAQRLRRLDPLGAPWGAPGNIASATTVAGALVATAGFADGSGEAVRFSGPVSVTFSANGTLFITEGVNAAVRAMTPPFCAVTTALNAGAGTPTVLLRDSGGAGGLGTSTLYLLFQTSCRVSLVNLTTFLLGRSLAGGGTSGAACGFANGLGTNALFSAPSSLVQDGAAGSFSRLLVADSLNHLVRVIAPATGAVATMLGSGINATIDGVGTSASFNGPRGLALDRQGGGFLFVAEFSGHTIRRAELATGLVATIAGAGGAAGFANGFGAAVAFANPFGIFALSPGLLLVADYSNNRVRALTCAPCPLGSYCGINAEVPTPCPGGTYGATAWLPAASACSPCAAAPGWGCPPGSTNVSGVVCPAGSFCAGGAAAPTPCTCPSACPTSGTVADPLALVWSSGFVAGNGTSGRSDGVGTAAQFTQPWNLGISPSGDTLCVPDLATHRLRLINLTTRAVATLAGSGTAASVDGVGAGASFNGPAGCTWGAKGIIFVSDGHRLRAVQVATGATSTLAAGAGGLGAADGANPSFSTPVVGAFLAPSALLLFVDYSGHTVRAVAPTGFVTTIAGLGGVAGYAGGVGSAARFNSPFGVAVDSGTGTAYVTDFNNHAVRAVFPDGTVATLAGNGSAGGADGTYAAARFTNPTGVALAPSGSLVVAEFGVGGDRIRLVSTATGTVVTLAGSGSRGLADATGADVWMNAPVGVAVVQATGRVLFSSAAAVRSLTCAPCARGFWCASGRATACPAGTYSNALNAGSPAACFLCTANQGWGCTPASTSAAGAPCPTGYWCAGGAAPPALCTCAAACTGGAKWEIPGVAVTVGTVAGTGAAGALNGPALSATFQGPRTVVINPGNGDMYISDWTVNVVRKLSSGVVSTLATGFNNPCGACMDPSNAVLYVADSGSNKLLAVAVATGVVNSVAGVGTPGAVNGPATSVALLNEPVDCALGVGGVVYIADKSNHMIRTLAGGVVTTLLGAGIAGYKDGAGAYALLNQPWGVALSRDNTTLFVAESAGNRVRAVALGVPGPVVSTLAGSGAAALSNGLGSAAAFSGPVSLLVGPRSGALYLADYINNLVRRIDPFTGNVSTLAGTATGGLVNGPAASAQFNRPIGLQASVDESVLFLAQSL